MNDYISLEELRAMSDIQIWERWCGSIFPFDSADCGQCVTQHKYLTECVHEDFKAEASRLEIIYRARPLELRASLAEIYALRLFHRDLYPSTPEPPAEAPALETVEIGEKSR